MKYYYTIETQNGIILTNATTKAEAIKKGRAEAIKYRGSLCIHKIDKETANRIDYIAIIEFPCWLRSTPVEKLNIKDTTVVYI